jgi:hypothetical protein
MASNPNPTRISTALWDFWTEFKKFEKGASYGGTYAPKPGYHNYRGALKSTDYSVEEVANDRVGSSAKCSAIDITLSDANMVKYSKRLDAAMRAKDKRLYIGGAPILREYIGTLDNKSVRCYMLTGGKAQGVGADSGPDSGRDKSHLWHVHISFIRKFCESADAMERVLSILKGETYSAWAKRHNVVVKPIPKPTTPAKPVPPKPTGIPTYKNGTRTLREGMTGSDVKFVQLWIGQSHMGKPDGKAGPKFTAGVKWYQKMHFGWSNPDGVVSAHGDTWRAMGVK